MTQSLEDYLEMVSFLSDDGEVRVTDIADRLQVTKPSVLSAMKALEEKGYIIHRRYGSVALTEEGSRAAQEIRERHHFLKDFLLKVLQVGEENAEADACKMEHVLSEETLQKMKALTLSYQ